MKKFFVIMIFMAMFLLTSTCNAEEILFRDIPWGVNATYVKNAIDIEWRKIDEVYMQYWTKWNIKSWSSNQTTENKSGFYLMKWGDIPFQVAGYDVHEIDAYFMYGESPDSIVNRSEDASRLYMATYTFHFEDVESGYNDLLAKLNQKYGEGLAETEESILWSGENNTALRLVWSRNPENDYEYIQIRYGKSDSDIELLRIDNLVAEEIIAHENSIRESNMNNYDGL